MIDIFTLYLEIINYNSNDYKASTNKSNIYCYQDGKIIGYE